MIKIYNHDNKKIEDVAVSFKSMGAGVYGGAGQLAVNHVGQA